MSLWLSSGSTYESHAGGTGLPQFYGRDYVFLVLDVWEEQPGWPTRARILMLVGGGADFLAEGVQIITSSWWLWRNAKRIT